MPSHLCRPEAVFQAPPALPPRDRAVVAVALLSFLAVAALGFAAGYTAAPPERCPFVAVER